MIDSTESAAQRLESIVIDASTVKKTHLINANYQEISRLLKSGVSKRVIYDAIFGSMNSQISFEYFRLMVNRATKRHERQIEKASKVELIKSKFSQRVELPTPVKFDIPKSGSNQHKAIDAPKPASVVNTSDEETKRVQDMITATELGKPKKFNVIKELPNGESMW